MSQAAILKTETSRKIFEQPGYTTDIRLTIDELSLFRDTIRRQYLDRIGTRHPELVERFAALGVERYHELSDLVDHEKLWPKQFRLFPAEVVERIKVSPVMSRLRDAFGEFSISDVVYGTTVEEGRKEIYWRLVRPNMSTDVGPLHADKWFHESLGSGEYGMFPPGATTVKIWLPIYCEPGRNGLKVVPGSHLKSWRYSQVQKGGYMKPQIEEDVDAIGAELVPTEPGTLLIFNERLLHGGAVNHGSTSRVSVEITMVFA
jgi:hypothetical protein